MKAELIGSQKANLRSRKHICFEKKNRDGLFYVISRFTVSFIFVPTFKKYIKKYVSIVQFLHSRTG